MNDLSHQGRHLPMPTGSALLAGGLLIVLLSVVAGDHGRPGGARAPLEQVGVLQGASHALEVLAADLAAWDGDLAVGHRSDPGACGSGGTWEGGRSEVLLLGTGPTGASSSVGYRFVPDTLTTRPDDFLLERLEGEAAPVQVARHLVREGEAPFLSLESVWLEGAARRGTDFRATLRLTFRATNGLLGGDERSVRVDETVWVAPAVSTRPAAVTFLGSCRTHAPRNGSSGSTTKSIS